MAKAKDLGGGFWASLVLDLGNDVFQRHVLKEPSPLLRIVSKPDCELADESNRVHKPNLSIENPQCVLCDLCKWFGIYNHAFISSSHHNDTIGQV